MTELNDLTAYLINQYGYDPGGYSSVADQLEGLKLFGKLDFNLNANHRLTVRHQYTNAEQTDRNASSSSRINFANNGVYFPTTTNSSAIELNSRFGTNLSNSLILGYTSVNDDRDAIGGDFPYVFIDDANGGELQFGTEAFSSANQLEQKIFTITDNFKIYKGDHTFTVGTHNEFYDIYNVFIQQNFGSYNFDNLDDFYAGTPSGYNRSYSLVDNITGDGTAAAADFKAIQLGFYAQDEWSMSNRFTLTYGLRLDIPIISDDPNVDPSFNTTSLPLMQAQ
jgi:outer membrane receptor for ferrienterochelin and colicin